MLVTTPWAHQGRKSFAELIFALRQPRDVTSERSSVIPVVRRRARSRTPDSYAHRCPTGQSAVGQPDIRWNLGTVPGTFSPVALIRFLDGKQRGKTATVDDAAINREGQYRFKKRDLTKSGGRKYYLKAVAKKRWVDKKIPEWTAALDDDVND